jgi:hypothetical protein
VEVEDVVEAADDAVDLVDDLFDELPHPAAASASTAAATAKAELNLLTTTPLFLVTGASAPPSSDRMLAKRVL